MADYIEREAAIEALAVWYGKACHPENMSRYNMGERAAYITAISEIVELPAADVRPVVRGKWSLEKITDAYGGDVWHRWKCSKCDAVCATGWEHTRDGAKPKYNFCPNCGADMREES